MTTAARRERPCSTADSTVPVWTMSGDCAPTSPASRQTPQENLPGRHRRRRCRRHRRRHHHCCRWQSEQSRKAQIWSALCCCCFHSTWIAGGSHWACRCFVSVLDPPSLGHCCDHYFEHQNCAVQEPYFRPLCLHSHRVQSACLRCHHRIAPMTADCNAVCAARTDQRQRLLSHALRAERPRRLVFADCTQNTPDIAKIIRKWVQSYIECDRLKIMPQKRIRAQKPGYSN